MSSLEINVHGQTVLVNEFNKVLRINIDSPFQDPSIPMKDRWEFGCKGFGINEEIVQILIEKNYRLFVHEAEDGKNYLLDVETLTKLLKGCDLEYKVKDTKLIILPKSFFKEL